MKKFLAIVLVVILGFGYPAVAEGEYFGKILLKVELETIAMASMESILDQNPETISKLIGKTFRKSKIIPTAGYKSWQIKARTQKSVQEYFGKKVTIFVAINPKNTSDKWWGLLIEGREIAWNRL